METVGKIFDSGPNNYAQFDTEVFDFAGDPPQYDANGVYNPGIDSRWIFKPNVVHSFGAFNILVDLDFTDLGYAAEIGLAGQQINWPVDMLFVIKQTGPATTTVSLGGQNGAGARFSEVLPTLLTGLVKVRVSYANLQWDIAIIHNKQLYSYTYKYQRPAVNGHTTSRFAFNNFGSPLVIKKFVIDIPIVKGQTLFVGDSITWGSGRPFGSRTFPELYNANDEKCSVFASGSAASGDVLACFEAIKLIAPSRIVLLIGDNDNFNTPNVFADNISTILDDWINALPANGVPMPVVTLMNLTPERYEAGYAALRDVINGLNLAVPHQVLKSWERLARTDNPDLIKPEYVVDHVHLSGLGHADLYAIT